MNNNYMYIKVPKVFTSPKPCYEQLSVNYFSDGYIHRPVKKAIS